LRASGRPKILHSSAKLFFHRLETMGKPSIAAINGFALRGRLRIGPGLLDPHCQAKRPSSGQPEVKLGINPRLWRPRSDFPGFAAKAWLMN